MLLDPQKNNETLEIVDDNIDWFKVMKALNSNNVEIDDKVYQEAYKNLRIDDCLTSRLNKAAKNLAINGGRGIYETDSDSYKIDLVKNFTNKTNMNKIIIITSFLKIKFWLSQAQKQYPGKSIGILIKTTSQKEFSNIKKLSFTENEFNEDIIVVDINSITTVAKRYNFAKKFSSHDLIVFDCNFKDVTKLKNLIINFYSILFFVDTNTLSQTYLHGNISDVLKIICWTSQQLEKITHRIYTQNNKNTNIETIPEILRKTRMTI